MNSISRSILARSLMTAATLAFMMASAAAVRAQTVIGADGASGPDCDLDYCDANGADGESVSSGGNTTTAIGGAGGDGGYDHVGAGLTGAGGNGGNATAIGGSSATAIGGAGGRTGSNNEDNGSGGNATATTGSPTATATATGGDSGPAGSPSFEDSSGGSATATAISNGSATSSATATSGAGGFPGAAATATSSATATGFGSATASAIATGYFNASATSFAETAYGGLAQAKAEADFGLSQSTAKTTFEGVSIQSTVSAFFGSTDAIAQGDSGQLPVDPGQLNAFAFSTALPNTAYATALTGSASNVADALLKSDDKIFGTAILESGSAGEVDSSSTLDFSFRGDLILGVVTGGSFDIDANGIDILSESVGPTST
jgi:hypothetical protein